MATRHWMVDDVSVFLRSDMLVWLAGKKNQGKVHSTFESFFLAGAPRFGSLKSECVCQEKLAWKFHTKDFFWMSSLEIHPENQLKLVGASPLFTRS